ncbi:MAG TPA: DUF899 family protein [Acidiferrobacterales bacterium]|nr:DUF899 family protein [Acidiferrobacterales bacterium]
MATKAKRKSAPKAKRKPASKSLHSERFPGENAGYRNARNQLLKAEMELRRRLEDVAAMRRKLPAGGPVPEDYEFEEGAANLGDSESVRRVKLSELFQPGKESLVIYSYMYGPNMEKPCPSCTSILDGLNGTAPHAAQRINLVVVAKSPIQRVRAFARERGWRNLRFLSSAGNPYNRDYHGETTEGSQIPALNVFVRRGSKIHHAYCTELLFAPGEKGQDMRHVDLIWPLWNLFDFTPEGRGKDWHPKLSYGS